MERSREIKHNEWNDWFDFQYGIKTNFELTLEEVSVLGPHKKLGKRYQGTHVQNFFKFFKKFKEAVILENPPSEFPSFVDIGCGAGRALIMAASVGFTKIYGVDFVPELVTLCQNNWNHYLKRELTIQPDLEQLPEMRLFLSDALSFTPPREDKGFLFYLFNPFQEKLLSLWLNRLPLFLEPGQRKKSYIAYMNPVYQMEFAKRGFPVVFKIEAENFNDRLILYRMPSENVW